MNLIMLSVFLLGLSPAESSECVPAQASQRTSWGQQNVVFQHDKPLSALVGGVVKVAYSEDALEGVLVEVYDHPERVLEEGNIASSSRTGQKRLAACVTGKSGRFSFKLKPGRYELRASKPIEWNCTSVLVEVRREATGATLTVQLEAAQ